LDAGCSPFREAAQKFIDDGRHARKCAVKMPVTDCGRNEPKWPISWDCATPPHDVRCGEELRHRINHLERLRRIQEDTGGVHRIHSVDVCRPRIRLENGCRSPAALPEALAVSRPCISTTLDHISQAAHAGIKVCQVVCVRRREAASISLKKTSLRRRREKTTTTKANSADHMKPGFLPASATRL